MFFDEVENQAQFLDRFGTPYEKIEPYITRNRITGTAYQCNAINLWNFEECFFKDDDFVHDH